MKKPVVKQDTCIGCGTCSALCSATFTVNGATATAMTPAGNSEAEIDSAIASCPTQSISWIEKD
jgi:ferredoxin